VPMVAHLVPGRNARPARRNVRPGQRSARPGLL
jgi:hypothetical protein